MKKCNKKQFKEVEAKPVKEEEACGMVSFEGFMCTLKYDHKGEHHAHSHEFCMEVFKNDKVKIDKKGLRP